MNPPCINCNKFAHGAISITKVLFGIDAADAATIVSRKSVCEVCPHYQPTTLGVSMARCALCNCFLEAKVRLAAERCPDEPARWVAEPVVAS